MSLKNENDLFDLLLERTGATSDFMLCSMLGIMPATLSRVRHGHLPLGASLVIYIHEVTNMAIKEIKSYITHGPQSKSAAKIN